MDAPETAAFYVCRQGVEPKPPPRPRWNCAAWLDN